MSNKFIKIVEGRHVEEREHEDPISSCLGDHSGEAFGRTPETTESHVEDEVVGATCEATAEESHGKDLTSVYLLSTSNRLLCQRVCNDPLGEADSKAQRVRVSLVKGTVA
eukprot:CAMPEP_0180489350 /NCGR_PEP_ID=MMETSP1036_2-20121128/38543_1 /TAXON_ID=632150 /ORGANISM="Azadinium spinosum, Strain 3D9" /LENGTH=109 /DNA_ID=CAMNT_0022497487 /DNA_START=314 /DNA_END=643 /DNA_ORIENTATION=-